MSTKLVSKQCGQGLHQFCAGTRADCACDGCHFGPCTKCGRDNLRRIFDGLCADCERDRVHATKFAGTPCCDCGSLGAYRMPADRTSPFRCTSCWGHDVQDLTGGQSSPVMALSCYAKDLSDPLHTWRLIRGAQFGCRCGAKKHDPQARKNMQGVGDALLRQKVGEL